MLCDYNRKHTHYHCLKKGCDKVSNFLIELFLIGIFNFRDYYFFYSTYFAMNHVLLNTWCPQMVCDLWVYQWCLLIQQCICICSCTCSCEFSCVCSRICSCPAMSRNKTSFSFIRKLLFFRNFFFSLIKIGENVVDLLIIISSCPFHLYEILIYLRESGRLGIQVEFCWIIRYMKSLECKLNQIYLNYFLLTVRLKVVISS